MTQERVLKDNASGGLVQALPKGGRVLLLQGPVGPFFRQLQASLEAQGHETWRVCFNAGDLLFAPRKRVIRFFGGKMEWQKWLEALLADGRFETLILFGSDRPAHRIAREVCKKLGVRVLALEEGYIRPGYVTVEEGGNNAASPLAGRLPPADFVPQVPKPDVNGANFNRMCWLGGFYYTARGLFGIGPQRELYHRRMTLLMEILYWTRNATRRIFNGERDFRRIERLLEHHDGRYYIVPLQVAADSNMGTAACGWNSARLIAELIPSFARRAPAGTRLVFKTHPMERGHNSLTPLILDTAAACGVADRVDVIDTGSLGLLARHSAGMITINSTSGLSAISHGCRLMVLGKAIYAHPALATCAQGQPDFDDWWSGGHVARPELRRTFLAWLKTEALVPGDFYSRAGIETACSSVARVLNDGPRIDMPVLRPTMDYEKPAARAAAEYQMPRKVGT
ncbi:capsular biosynthesis protein [Pseudooceanicola sp. CBS1P-1]|uniref:Capsular biosynthesis protein n=1 Tax=Pseudooceanicola albus TaxID=2692189 RepID=A0A6L7G7F6_9RHOB|nr:MULTISPECIES: capsular biosynthesis protein [Pseudooceanicola]MBT9382902.1 capsular biosynthesis protein [Pseudooceanicola endophyticus]MXN20174.1 capsular biosynthesis protein [Pseudooceanicola albus]